MKIELWYDAAAQETDILINGAPVKKNDIYGFLYPVRNYPMQSWLYPNGSWKGLEYQIADLARDESVELTFHGRRCDYEDLGRCLSENNMILLEFAEWDVCSRYDKLFLNLCTTLEGNDSMIRKLLSSLGLDAGYVVDFDVSAVRTDWAYGIRNDADLANAGENSANCCCYVYDSFFTSYEKLQALLSLTRSLKIPADAIYCCFRDRRKKDDYEYYARSFKKMHFRFCLESSGYADDARNKYGIPFVVRQRISCSGMLLKTLCAEYLKLKERTQAEFSGFTKNIVTLTRKEEERYQTIRQLRNHIDKFRYGMEVIYEYMDILLSVSKENKEEVYHYECIDKLDENINLYLDAKAFGGEG